MGGDEVNLGERLQEGNRLLTYGEGDAARAAYLEVWRAACDTGDDYFACAAAHMLGAMESMPPEERLQWHLASLEWAGRVADGRVKDWYPSIYLNLGHVLALLDRPAEALAHYEKALLHTHGLDDPSYAAAIRAPIRKALAELRQATGSGR